MLKSIFILFYKGNKESPPSIRQKFIEVIILTIFYTGTIFASDGLEDKNSISNNFEGTYQISPGDIISLMVWNEPTHSADQLLVRPDGFVSAPIIGEVKAGGITIKEFESLVAKKLSLYFKDQPSVVVSILAVNGSQVFVLGKVNAPGAYPMQRLIDVTQAIALARGLNPFASENKIKILRRDSNGNQTAIPVKYGKIKSGDDLETNIILRSGDIVLVP